jgi:hypothetical protein
MTERVLRAAAALAAPALALSLLAVPEVRSALLSADAPAVQAQDLRPVAVQQPGTGRRAARGWGTTVFGGSSPVTVSSGTIGRGPRTAAEGRVRPVPLPPPPPPPAPWAATRPIAGRTQPALPPVERGPVQRLTRTVAAGEGVLLPAGTGVAHVLCSGPGAPRATYWLDDSSGTGTVVHRADGSGTYDLWWRRASRSDVRADDCPAG